MLTTLPTVSVIIPALNEESCIGYCLDSLARVRYRASLMEVIVADNGSTDSTVMVARSFAAKMNLKVIQRTDLTVSALRNFGASCSTGERLIFLDADCVVSPDWLEQAVRLGEAKEETILGASYLVPANASWVARIWQHHEEGRRRGRVSYVGAHNLHVNREVFERVGGFNEALESNEDYEFCQRAITAGCAVEVHPPIAVVHLGSPQRLRNFYARERWHGKHVLQVFLQDIKQLRNFRAVLFAVYTLVCIVLVAAALTAAVVTWKWSLPVIATAIWLAPSILLGVRDAVQTRHWGDLPGLVLLFFIYGMARSMCLLDWRTVSVRKSTKVATA